MGRVLAGAWWIRSIALPISTAGLPRRVEGSGHRCEEERKGVQEEHEEEDVRGDEEDEQFGGRMEKRGKVPGPCWKRVSWSTRDVKVVHEEERGQNERR
jgi:hypothetical protein